MVESDYENAVFVSYAWGGESERAVDELEQAFAERGIRIVRDKKGIDYKGSIKAFEQRIAHEQCVILVISDEYLRFENCMYELIKVYENSRLRERIFPIVLSDARIFNAADRVSYIEHWERKIAKLNRAIKRVKEMAGLAEIIADLEKFKHIRDHFDRLIDLLSDMNALTPTMYAGKGYITLVEAVEHFLASKPPAEAGEGIIIKTSSPTIVFRQSDSDEDVHENDLQSTQPEKIDRYGVKKLLGQGGMSAVYQVFDPSMQRDIALKILSSDVLKNKNFYARFQLEIRTIANIDHPSIVKIFDVGEWQGQPFYTMQLMSGDSLAEMLAQGPLTVKEILRILERLGSALERIHAKGIFHRDLKPSNILFDQDRNAYLADFGIAKVTGPDSALITQSSEPLGTPYYMSPEQWSAQPVDARSDIYSLGIILYEMFAGQKPFDPQTPFYVSQLQRDTNLPPLSIYRTDLPAECQAIIEKATAKDPARRYACVQELSQDLHKAFQKQKAVKPIDTPQRPNPLRHRILLVTLITLSLLILIYWIASSYFSSANLIPTMTTTHTPQATNTRLPSALPSSTRTSTRTNPPTRSSTATPTSSPSPEFTQTRAFTLVPTDTPPPAPADTPVPAEIDLPEPANTLVPPEPSNTLVSP